MDLFCSASRLAPEDTIDYPGDKSITHRALLIALLAPGETHINGANLGGAVTPLLEAITRLGVSVEIGKGGLTVGQLRTVGTPREVPYLNLGSSSTAARLLIGLLAGLGVGAVVDGDETLRPRPVDWVVEPLRSLGADIVYLNGFGKLPVEIRPSRLRSGDVVLQIGSAQALSALLFAGLAAGVALNIKQKVQARDHTERLLRSLGCRVDVEGDWVRFEPAGIAPIANYRVPVDPSAVVYPIVAHLLSPVVAGAPLVIDHACLNPTRTGLLQLLQTAGADIRFESVIEHHGEPTGRIIAYPGAELKPFTLDNPALFHALIDEVPLAAALATQVNGESAFYGLAELTFKETNRIESTQALLADFGADARIDGESLFVRGLQPLASNTRVRSFGDHRLAMTAATMACSLGLNTVVIEGGCVATSFPEFPRVMRGLGYVIEENEDAFRDEAVTGGRG
jgi:3-phosphoshikimate 1-carboxyvinyltransferase